MAIVDQLALEIKVGQLFLVGFPGGDAGEASLRSAVSERPFGNVILFSRNCASAEAAARAARVARDAIGAASGIAPLVAVDQEGGVVARLSEGVTPLPGAMAMAAAVAGGGASLADVEELAFVSGTELRSLGIDWNLAPVSDVNSNPANPVIGVRSFGEDPVSVAAFASAYARGLARAGVAACAKHFPGHGDTSVDSHLGLPRVDSDLQRLEAIELAPFRRLIADGIASVMTSHVLFPAVEPDEVPATLSRRVIDGLLRGNLGFRGVVVTDCLEMKAVDGRYGEPAPRAIEAGADIVTVSHDLTKQNEAFDSVLRAVRSGRLPEARIDESLARVTALKAAIRTANEKAGGGLPPARRTPEAVRLSERVAVASLGLIGDAGLPDLTRGGLYVDVMPESATAAEDAAKQPAWSVGAALAAMASTLRVVSAPADPDDAAIARIVELAESTKGPVSMGVHALSRHGGQAELAARLSESCRRRGEALAFVLTRDPYDARRLRDITGLDRAILCAYEYSALSARAIAETLVGGASPRGLCPVSAMAEAAKIDRR